MSYGPPQGGGYPPQGQGYPQQQQWNGPPGPPQGNQGYPPYNQQQQSWSAPQGPPPGQYNQGGWNAPPGPPPGQYHQGPPQQQGGWGGPPPQHHGGYPQGGYPPPGGSYGGGGQPAPPSPGYDPRAQAQGDASRDADALRAAMKGFGTDEATLIRILSKPDPLQMALLRNTYNQRLRRNLEADIKSETSKYFRDALVGIVQGPLMYDVHEVNRAIKGIGTKETLLNDILIGRSNADMRAIKQAYQQTFRESLESAVKGDLSLKTEQLFSMVMAATRAEESTLIDPTQVDRDSSQLHGAMGARMGTDQITVCSILSQRSDGQIRAIANNFKQKYQRDLESVIKSEFSGHMEDALLLMVRRACDRAMTEAVLLEDTMAGLGTKDNLLVSRVVRLHWDKALMDQVKRAFAHKYKRDLVTRVRGETSGDYQRLLVAMLS
ncbi:hypothetical protein PV10_07857 [Exophiala mesophila]|uniref:Annexin n=1 Tax=Exophiala mesophila TaxID=212818 RepID=A0A0D1Z974_EXOME|nr:uncharacterized protein PV10_07857 [Exophiala mesophila]KIV90569.1 hypothetical protein PV10_07857 [Exophiala mesophila]